MSLSTRIIIFIVAVVAFVAALLAHAALAQAQDLWYEPPAKITVELRRVTPHHHESKRVRVHHGKHKTKVHGSLGSAVVHKLPSVHQETRSGLPSVYYRLTGGRYFDPEYVEWLEIELARARRCRCPG